MKLISLLLAVLFFTESYSQNCNEANSLVSIRTRKAGSTESVIFTLKKDVTASSTITAAHPPFIQDGSGNTVHIKGCNYKQVLFKNIVWTCHTNIVSGDTYLIRQVKNIGQLEGVISYIIGYRCSAKHVVNYEYDDGNYKKIVVRIK